MATSTLVVKAKCMTCSLHFVAYSWEDDWSPSYCPECGATEPFILWKERDDGLQIFNVVPGATPLAEIA